MGGSPCDTQAECEHGVPFKDDNFASVPCGTGGGKLRCALGKQAGGKNGQCLFILENKNDNDKGTVKPGGTCKTKWECRFNKAEATKTVSPKDCMKCAAASWSTAKVCQQHSYTLWC